MGKPKAPKPPDPKDTSAAATGTNVSTAIANSYLNNANQVTPDGKITYSNDGYQSITDPYTNKTYQIPLRTATTTLSDAQQGIYDTNQSTQKNLANIGEQQSSKIGSLLGTNVDLSAQNIGNYTNTHFGDDFNKQWATNQTDLENQLANRGVQQGSAAYSKALADFNTNKANAYDNMQGNQYGLAQQSILTERNQPLNEISALLSGSQVSQPQAAGFNQSPIATTDNAGLINQNYQDKLAAWQQNQQSQQGLLGGLFGLGASAIKYSDRRLKKDIERVGTYANGLARYTFEYVWGGGRKFGLMSDEVRALRPEAVTQIDGFDAVDYDKALV